MQYSTIQGTQGICPTGWHTPTLAELETLKTTVGEEGNSLKEIGQGTGEGTGTNTSGFSALIAGKRYNDGTFSGLGTNGLLWRSTEISPPSAANHFELHSWHSIISFGSSDKQERFCIRCIRDGLIESLNLNSPNGGENWQAGSQQNITWTSTNVTNVKIEYSLNNGASWSTVTPSTQANTGVFTWTVVDTVATECKIKISDAANSSLFDISDNTFTISNTTFQLTVSLDTVARMRAACAHGRMQFIAAQPVGVETQLDRLGALRLACADGSERRVEVDTVLALLGLSPRLGPVADWGLAMSRRQLVVDTEQFATSVPGIHAVGDIVTYPGKRRLIVCGFHEATLAAYGAAARLRPDQPLLQQYTTTSPRLHRLLGVASHER